MMLRLTGLTWRCQQHVASWFDTRCTVLLFKSFCRRDAETGELLEGDDAEANLLEVLEETQQQGQEQQVRTEAATPHAVLIPLAMQQLRIS
jgi:hypothetical protein